LFSGRVWEGGGSDLSTLYDESMMHFLWGFKSVTPEAAGVLACWRAGLLWCKFIFGTSMLVATYMVGCDFAADIFSRDSLVVVMMMMVMMMMMMKVK
jgi:hypothetical protein